MTTDNVLIGITVGQLRALMVEAATIAISRSNAAVAAPDEIGGIDLAARITGLSKDRIHALTSEKVTPEAEKRIPHKKVGNRLKFSKAELEKWQMGETVEPKTMQQR